MRRLNTVLRRRLMSAAAPTLGAVFAAALAQGAQAQDAQPADGNTVGEVVVTAQFREQNLQQTPIAITAVNAAMLEQRSQTNLYQVASNAPNVTLKPAGAAFGSAMVAFIRGVGQTDFNFSQEPGVGIYVDDVYYATLTGSLLDLIDLDRVEVLRGPQGTLAGRNSIGGAIKLFSKKPMGGGVGSLEATYGSRNRIDARGVVDFTVVPDQLFVRISAATRHRNGYVTRVDYKCTHPTSTLRTFTTGGCELGKEGGQAFTAGKVALRWVPSDNLEINITGDATNDKSEVQANTLLYARPNGLSLDGVPYDARFVPYGPNSQDPNRPNDPFLSYATFLDPEGGPLESRWKPLSVAPINHFESWGVAATVDWKLNENLALKSISSFRKFTNAFAENTPASPIGVQLLLQTLHHKQYTQEFRLNGQFGDNFDYTLGAFYAKQDGDEIARVDLPYVGAGVIPGVRNFAFDFIHGPDPTPSTAKAVFGHVDWRVTDQIELIGGIRYSKDRKTYTFRRHNPDGTLPCAVPNFLPGGCANWLVAGLDGQSSTFSGDRLDYRAEVAYHVTEDVMAYVQYATGYKSGGSNARPFFGRGAGCAVPECQVVAFNPETLTAYEGGLKTSLFDRRLRFNTSVFYNNYKNIILQLSSCPANSPGPDPAAQPCALPTNVGSAHVKGAEFEFEAHPFRGLEIDGSLSYLDFQYTRTNFASTGVSLDAKTPYTPKWKWNVGAQYEFEMGGLGTLTPRFDVSHQSDTFSTPLNDPTSIDPSKTRVPVNAAGIPTVRTDRISGYTVANFRLTWKAEGGWQAALEVTNLTDKLYYLTLFDLAEGGLPGYAAGQPAVGRSWALTVKKTF